MKAGMDAARWRRIEAVLDRALDAPAADRERVVAEACGGDGELRREVLELLAAEAASGPLEESGSRASWLAGEMLAATSAAAGDELERLGPYRIEGVLGAGGMGVVYAGWDTRLERAVAIKLLPRGLGAAMPGEAVEERFLREARTASALDHPNLCPIFDIGTSEDGRLYFVMPLYRGRTLKARLDASKGEGLPRGEALDIARQVAAGLERAHQAGIVHRDVKPANLFLAEHGEVKVLDFGLARIADEAALTATGAVLGTPGYMAPEQVEAGELDHRVDIWAFGVLLYEMLAGERPFPTGSGLSAVAAVLHMEPEPLAEKRGDLPPSLLELVERSLRKDPQQRPASMTAVRRSLESLGEAGEAAGLDDQALSAPTRALPATTRKRRVPIAAALLVVLLALALLAVRSSRAPTGEAPVVPATGASSPTAKIDAPRGLLVLPFRDLHATAEEESRGLGAMIAEMLITDLRGSPDLDVATSSRLHRAMKSLAVGTSAQPGTTLAAEELARLAEETGRELVLHGSFVRIGERFRILATLEDPGDGDVLFSKQVESSSDGLFTAVDEISVAVRGRLQAGASPGGDLRSVSTASLEAMRAYSEGLLLSRERDVDAAVASLRRAVELDPDFALAWRALGLVHDNVGRRQEAERCFKRAVELADRLPPKQRVPVLADHFGSRWASLEKSLEIYREGLELYPSMTSWRNNLGYTYAQVERYEEALEQYDTSIALGTSFGYAHVNRAFVLLALGRGRAGLDGLESYAGRHPGEWVWAANLGWLLAVTGEQGAGLEQIERARSLVAEPQELIEHYATLIGALRADWPRADEAAAALAAMERPRARRLAAVAEARHHLFHGRSERALEALGRALDIATESGDWPSSVHVLLAELHLDRREAASALAFARRAIDADPGGWYGRRGLFFAALAEQALGRPQDADARLEELRSLESADLRVERRLVHHLAGRLAAMRGEFETARLELRRAAELLPARGLTFDVVRPPHVAIFFELAHAASADGDAAAALAWADKAASAGSERLEQPVAWTRSLLLRARLLRAAGELEAARRDAELFLRYRSDGDLDRDLVEAARQLLN